MDQTYMKEKPILPLLLSMALPMVISMFVNSLYNIIDSIFVAKISEDAMNALSLVYPVQNLINSVAVGFGVGINAVIVGNVKIGKHCVIGANSVVTKDIPDYCVAVGSPAKVIKKPIKQQHKDCF